MSEIQTAGESRGQFCRVAAGKCHGEFCSADALAHTQRCYKEGDGVHPSCADIAKYNRE